MRPCRSTLLAAALALLLAGCGPGVGGTGTGNGLDFHGATPALVCGTDLAGVLTCHGTTTGAPNTIEEGTGVLHFADDAANASVRVAFAANAIELEAPCRALVFSGDFGISATHDARFFGTYTDPATSGAPASLQVQTLGADVRDRLSVTMRDGDGRIVLGPVTVRRVDRPPADGC